MRMNEFKMDELSRRSVVQWAARSFLGVSAASSLSRGAEESAANSGGGSGGVNVIYLYMDGGMTHLDTFDPKPGTDTGGKTPVIKTAADGVQISGYFPKLAQQMKRVALVRSLTSKQGEHERAQYLMHTSYNMIASIRHPSLGSWVTKMTGKMSKTLPGYVTIGGGASHSGPGFLDGRYAPLPVGNASSGLPYSKLAPGVDDAQFMNRLKLADTLDKGFRTRYKFKDISAYTSFYHDAIELMKGEDTKAFDLSKEDPKIREAYGNNGLGQGVLLARRLVQHGVRFVEVGYGGWDMHFNLWDGAERHIAPLDTAVATLLQDLASSGLIKNTLVVLGTDFGRTPKINDRLGRDHHPRAFSCFMAGAGVKGGYVHGKTDSKGYAVEEAGVSVEDYNATIAQALGIPLDKTIFSPSGRPFTFANKGKPIKEMLA